MARQKRTKKKYQELFDNPARLFGEDAQVVLWPNGVPEIWIKNRNGTKGVCITASEGPACFSVRVKHFIGAYDFTVLACNPDYEPQDIEPIRELEVCQYNQDEVSQAFKAWYMADSHNSEHRTELLKSYETLKAANPDYGARFKK